MKNLILIFAIFFTIGCQTVSSEKELSKHETNEKDISQISTIRKINFQNFTFPWTKTFGVKEKEFTLQDGFAELSDGRQLSLKSVAYVDVAADFDEQALVCLEIEDGNASYEMLYVFTVKNGKPKLLESFEFGKNNTFFGTAFGAHGELVIETFHQLSGDAECCPSVLEIAYYKWQQDRFVLQGEPQKISNGYTERKKNKVE